MIPKEQLVNNLKEYVINQVNRMSKSSPGVAFLKPYIVLSVNKDIFYILLINYLCTLLYIKYFLTLHEYKIII